MEFKRNITITAIMIVLITLFASCINKEVQKLSDYITYSVCYANSDDKAQDFATYEAAVYKLDLHTSETSQIFTFPLNAMYALGVYDEKTNSVYYSREKDNNTFERQRTGDQIFVHNLTTGTDLMLTDDLLAVNNIIPVDDAVFFVAARLSNVDSLVLGKIDLTDGHVEYWDETYSTSIKNISVDNIQKRIYVSVFDYVDRDRADAEADFDPYKIEVTRHSIYSYDYDLSDKLEVLHKDNLVIRALCARDNLLLYTVDDTTSPLPTTNTTSEMIDLNNMNVMLRLDESLPRNCAFSKDKKGVYVIGDLGEYRGIYYYDFDTREYVPITANSLGHISDFRLVYQNEN